MPSYSFSCETCGHFTLWNQHMEGNKQQAECPVCGGIAKRVFKPPITFKMDGLIKRRIENGMEPRIVNKNSLPKSMNRRPTASRPWQAGN
ncbi:FmdB family zinc ribbon protein [Virgibacillus sp. L01]|uniref:FmdB family zinc ribbon protein n=1 Tax=Virgibacillus sp. L01 TaxID=3457429 RepID=UPI003FD31D79